MTIADMTAEAIRGEIVLTTLRELSLLWGDASGGIEGAISALKLLRRSGCDLEPRVNDDMDSPRRVVCTPDAVLQSAKSRIQEALESGETERVEFKETFIASTKVGASNTVPEDVIKYQVVKAVAGMMNTRGGTVLIGVRNDGTVCGIDADLDCGQRTIDDWQKKLASTLGDRIYPSRRSASVSIDVVKIDSQPVGCVAVRAEGPELTYARDFNDRWHVYLRSGTENRDLSIRDIEDIVVSRRRRRDQFE